MSFIQGRCKLKPEDMRLIAELLARSKKLGVDVRFVDSSWCAVVGWTQFGSRLAMNQDQAAGLTIVRKAAISKGKTIKRPKPGLEWSDLYAKPENISGLFTVALKKINNKQRKHPPLQSFRAVPQQSMGTALGDAQRVLPLALGADRRHWAAKLKAFRKGKCWTACLAPKRGELTNAWGDQAF